MYIQTYDSCRTEALLPKVMVDTTPTDFASIQPFLKILARWAVTSVG
jgi:hypothetical protein